MSFILTLMMGITVFASDSTGGFINYNYSNGTKSTFVTTSYFFINGEGTLIDASSMGSVCKVDTMKNLSGTANIYNDASKTSFFFKGVVPPISLLEAVQPNLQNLGGSLVSPILLKVGLAVLALLLGVQLVPRLIHSLMR